MLHVGSIFLLNICKSHLLQSLVSAFRSLIFAFWVRRDDLSHLDLSGLADSLSGHWRRTEVFNFRQWSGFWIRSIYDWSRWPDHGVLTLESRYLWQDFCRTGGKIFISPCSPMYQCNLYRLRLLIDISIFWCLTAVCLFLLKNYYYYYY